MAREPTGGERAAAVAAAGLGTLVALPAVVVGVLLFGLSSAVLDGCEELDSGQLAIGPTDAGVSVGADGAVVVHPGPCETAPGFASVRVDAADGTTVWLADATADGQATPRRFDSLVIGRAPAGFADVVPLAAPLDPTATYTVRLGLVASTTLPSDQAADGVSDLAYDAGGQSATFRPADLSPATVSYRGERMVPAAFADLACER